MAQVGGGQMILKKLISVSFILLAIAVTQDHSGYAGSFLQNGPDARSIAMGNSLTASKNLNIPSYFNPAGVASISSKRASFSHQLLSLDRRQSIVSLSTPLPPIGGISVGWIGGGVNNIDGRDLTGRQTEQLKASENIFFISFGIAPIKHLMIGGSVKLLQNQLPNIDSTLTGNGVGFDFGVLYDINKNFSIGFAVKNINSAYSWSNKFSQELGLSYKDKFPIQLRFGSEYRVNSLIWASDIGAYFNNSNFVDYDYRIGAEYIFLDNYFFRAGYRKNKFAFGVGLKYSQYNNFISLIDYTIVIEPVTSPTHVISYAINF